jgi:hypothetical protein
MDRKSSRLSGLIGALLALGCTGNVVGPTDGDGSGTAPGSTATAGSGSTGSTGSASLPSEFVPSGSRLRRLTVSEYQNSLRDLLGPAIVIPVELEADTVLNGFAAIGASRMAFSPRATEQLEAAALDVASQAVSDVANRASLVPCTPAATVDDACSNQFVQSFGRRAFRRPLTQEEIDRYVTVARTAAEALGDFWGGIEYAIAGLLQSPHFLYRAELGRPDVAKPSLYVLDDYQLATRLSFLLWNTTPDDALLDAAAAGELSTAAGLQAASERLLASERAHSALSTFFTEMLRLAELDTLPQSAQAFPQMTATLGAAMRSETLSLLTDIVFTKNADYRDLFTTQTTFVDPELALLYGLPPPQGSGFVEVSLPADGPRLGYLGQGSFLALNAHISSTSPTYRGKFVREVLLCSAIPPPPPDVVAVLPEDTGTGGPQTMRDKLTVHRTDPACAGCHAVMDPIGLALEHFDGIGAYRDTDQGLTIDATGELDGVPFDGLRGLAEALKEHPDLGSCLTRSLFRYATGHLESEGEEPLIQALSAALSADGYRVQSLLGDLVQSEGFRFVGAPE